MTFRSWCAVALWVVVACGDDEGGDDMSEPTPDGGTIDGSLPLDATLDSTARADTSVAEGGTDGGTDSGDGIVEERVSCLGDAIGSGDQLLPVHTSAPSVQASSSRLLSADARWILRDRATHAIVATGAGASAVHLSEAWLALRTSTTLEVRRAQDATAVWSKPIESSPFAKSGIALDGSYVWLATEKALRVFDSTEGRELLSHPGNYANAQVIARADELRILAADHRVERVPLTGVSRFVAFAPDDSAHSWSADGRYLLAMRYRLSNPTGSEVVIYDADGTERGRLNWNPYASFGAYGDYVWIHDPFQGATVWWLGDGTAPRLWARGSGSISGAPLQWGSWVVFRAYADTWTLVDLSQPTLTPRRVPSSYDFTAFTMAGRELYFATEAGVYAMPEGAERPARIACGAVREVALAADGTFALAIGSKQVLLADGKTRTVRATLPGGRELRFSREGNVLGMIDGQSRLTLFDARSGALLLQEPAPLSANLMPRYDYDLSADGSRYLVTQCVLGDCRSQRIDRAGSRDSLASYQAAGYFEVFPRIAPAGARSAYPAGPTLPESATTMVDVTVGTGSTAGRPLVWLDDERLLVNRYVVEPEGDDEAYEGTYVVSPLGEELGRSPATLDETRATALRAGTLVFSRTTGRLYASTGADTTPVLAVGDGAILGDANDEQLLYLPLKGPNAGALQLRGY